MKRLALAAVAVSLFVALATATPRAQDASPSPDPDPLTYNDPGMNFTAPAGAKLAGRKYPALRELPGDLTPVAAWALNIDPANGHPKAILKIEMESFTGDPPSFEGRYESQMHDSGDLMIRGKTSMPLANGMPAYFMEITSGSGLDTAKEFSLCWADGVRGVVISVTARLGDMSADQAKAIMKTATATRYPIDQP